MWFGKGITMKPPLEFFVPFLLVPLLLLSPIIHAQEDEPIVVEPVINIDLQGVIDAINNSRAGIGQDINAVPPSTFGLFTGWVDNSLLDFNNLLLEFAEFLLTANPDPDVLLSFWQSIVLIISSFYLLIFFLVGFMFLFHSISPEKRGVAKEWLKNAFLMIIGVNVSFYLYKILLELATAITQFLWLSGFEQFFQTTNYAGQSTAFLVFYLIAISLAAITLFARYLVVLAGVMLFPIGVFLYFVPPLQNWGKLVFNFIGVFLFMQFIDVLIFIASNQIALDLAGQQFAGLVPALAFLLVAVINVLLIVYAVLKSAFSIASNSKIISFAFSAVSGRIPKLGVEK